MSEQILMDFMVIPNQVIFDSSDLWSRYYEFNKSSDEADGLPTNEDYLLRRTADDVSFEWDDMKSEAVFQMKKRGFHRAILIGSLGLWNGRHDAYAIFPVDKVIRWEHDDVTIEYEEGDIWLIERHHDGNNYFKMLLIKPGAYDGEYGRWLDSIGTSFHENLDKDKLSVVTVPAVDCFKCFIRDSQEIKSGGNK